MESGDGISEEAIKADMARMIADARYQGLWLYLKLEGRWFTPDELTEAHAEGHFLYNRPNWMLRLPAERIAELTIDRDRVQKTLDDAKAKLA